MLDAILRIFALTRKELLAVLKDPRGRFTLFIPPILQCLIFGYAASYDLTDVPYALLDQDQSDASRELLARLDGSGIFHRVADVVRAENLKASVNDGKALLAIQIDQEFERRLMSGQAAEIQVLADARNSNTAGTALGYVGVIVDGFNANWRATHSSPSSNGQLTSSGVQITTQAWYNPNLETRWNMIPALIGTLTMLQTLLLTAMSVAREREQGTFDQLLVTPFRPVEIMAGKAIPSVLIGMGQATTILLVAQLWFRIPFVGSFVVLYIGIGLFLVAAVGIGLLVSSIAATMQQAMLYSFMVNMPFALLSGLTTPISSMPLLLQYATWVNPLRHGIEIVHRVYLEGANLHQLIPQLWPLALIALVTLSGASWMFRHRLT
ncbi:MAG TPA: ABC transporter permease [Gemmataceae bacterium]|jgi:ABC-2 type transport system permease protein|nr:ABC transporter permease [Gemmataceae bacterium]